MKIKTKEMKKLLLVLSIIALMLPKQIKAQNNNGALAGALVGAIAVGAAAAAAQEAYNEAIELQGAQYVLANTDYTVFSLSRINRSGKKAKDQSAVSIYAFRLSAKGEGRQILLALLSAGWVNENGVDFSKIRWEVLSAEEWFDMMRAYVKRASDVDLSTSELSQSIIINNGVKKGNKLIVKFPKLSGDYYKVKDYSDDYKIVYNEKSFGLFIKETRDLVQVGRGVLIKAHEYMAIGSKE